MLKYFIGISLLLLGLSYCNAQLLVDTSSSPEFLVRNILVGEKQNLTIEQINYSGGKQRIAEFNCNLKYNNFPKGGIILSTGNVFDAIGPNDSNNKSSESFISNDKELEQLANGKTFDVACLEFDFIPYTDSISFRFFFASEEYPEYINRNVNDIFAFILSNKNQRFRENLAWVNETNSPISVDNINHKKNSAYYISNLIWNNSSLRDLKDSLQLMERSMFLQFDGLTTVFNVGSKVVPYERYHLKIAIADVGDRMYDSAIFLEANSFVSNGKEVKDDLWVKELVENKDVVNAMKMTDSTVSLNLNIQFEFGSAKIVGDTSFNYLDIIAQTLISKKELMVQINGHTDSVGADDFNKKLSLERAKAVCRYLRGKGVMENRMLVNGFGETMPVDERLLHLNRRVELVFRKK